MKVERLQHKHGGKITSIDLVRHDTTTILGGRARSAYWEFVGRVEWSDGTVSERANISPICVCRDPDDLEACRELDVVMAHMQAHLRANGRWAGPEGQWVPHATAGETLIP
jgi:hypothetical protein